MPTLKLFWATPAELQFEQVRKQAVAGGRLKDFAAVHNKIVTTLSDVETASEIGEPLYHTRKPGGIVRKWVYRMVAVTFLIFPDEKVGWITRYQVMPASWPF